VEADTIAAAWHESVRALLHRAELVRYDSLRGACSEAHDVMIQIRQPQAEPIISPDYPAELVALVDSYTAGFLGHPDVRGSTASDRLYAWGARFGGGPGINQVARAEIALRDVPESRSTILGFWDPAVDPRLENPVSPLVASLRIRGGFISSTLVARSVDAWLGAFPMFVGFIALVGRVSERLGCRVGPATFVFLSYHLYDLDLPVARHLGR